MYHIVALGELLIDFTPGGTTEDGVLLFQRNPGGAPANALTMASRFGCRTAFIGKVGNDNFGEYLRDVLVDRGIDVSGLVMDNNTPTTLAFVQINAHGDRSFSFYRNPGADLMLRSDDVHEELIQQSRIFHFGSLSMTDEPARSATLKAINLARSAGRLVSFDPNYRPLLWPSVDAARTEILRALPLTHLLKVSEEEAELLTGETDCARAATRLIALGPSVVLITRGEHGVYYHTFRGEGSLPAYAVNVVDTTGSGDAFVGVTLARIALLDRPLHDITAQEWEDILADACAAGSLCATRKGAINAMPTPADIARCRSGHEGR